MKIFIYIHILLLFSLLRDNPVVIKLEVRPEIYTTDKLGNSYVYGNNQLKKYSSNGILTAQYNRLDLGNVYSIDASDPLQILLFYKDYNQIIFLDSKLNQIGKALLLDEINLSEVSTVCKSKQLAVWIYDKYVHKLLHYSMYQKTVDITINLDKYPQHIGEISFLLENGDALYLNQQNKAIWVFDQFGNSVHQLDIQTNIGFQVLSDKLVYHDKKQVFMYSLKSQKADTLAFGSFPWFDNARLQTNWVYLLNADSITMLPLKNNL